MTRYSWWKDAYRTSEAFLNAHPEDRARNMRLYAHKLRSASSILDVGVGDGHTTAQILGRLLHSYTVDLLDPDRAALTRARGRLHRYPVGESYDTSLLDFNPRNKRWDVVLASHAQYHWADKPRNRSLARLSPVDRFQKSVEQAFACVAPGGALVIGCAPHDGAHFRLLGDRGYSTDVSAERINDLLRGYCADVQYEDVGQRYYVGGLYDNPEQLALTYEWLGNAAYRAPNPFELQDFRARIKELASPEGYLQFKDVIITAHKPAL